MIEEIIDDLMRHAAGLRTAASKARHPMERDELLNRAREFEQMASASNNMRGWSQDDANALAEQKHVIPKFFCRSAPAE
jgi:hypothetical protein